MCFKLIIYEKKQYNWNNNNLEIEKVFNKNKEHRIAKTLFFCTTKLSSEKLKICSVIFSVTLRWVFMNTN
jgi:hypothetical protein